MKYFLLLLLVAFGSFKIKAQLAGKSTYAFLNLNPSARSLALGTNSISVADKDLSVAWQNSAALNPGMHNNAFVSYNNYISDIKSGYFSYARTLKNQGTLALSIMYLDYGKFDGYLPNGLSTGVFTVKDQCIQLGYGKALTNKIRVGASLNYIYSIYESFVSSGLSTNLSAMYDDTAKNISITGIVKNIGFQAIPYSGTSRQPLPLGMDIAIGKKLKHLPFRYNLVIHDLQKPDMRYSYASNLKDENGNIKIVKMTMGDNILRHLTLGGELNLSKHFVVRFGYNHMRRKEASPEQKRGTVGFSWGLGFKISKFIINYGSASLFPGYNANQFSLQCNLGDFYKKK
ncbi:MAG: type IX secretion system protein PorQ [bacterium]|nr:type IX secretion system protein PorQ [bacterium]